VQQITLTIYGLANFRIFSFRKVVQQHVESAVESHSIAKFPETAYTKESRITSVSS